MTYQRVIAFVAATCIVTQQAQDVSGFGVNHPLTATRLARQSTTAIRAEPSASEKAAELRKKAEAAKSKAEELKKVAEQKAEAAMLAVKKASESSSASKSATSAKSEPATAKTPTPPSPKPDKASTRIVKDPLEGAIIPINSETVEFTSGVLGGAVALALGASPVFAVVAAAAANYVSKKDDMGEVTELVQAISKASLNTINWFAKLDSKYAIVGKLSESLDKSLDQLKNSEGESAETVKQIEERVAKTSKKIQQIADEIDLIEGGKQALGAVGDVLETSIDKAVGVNKEYKLTERAAGAAKKAIDKAKESGQ
eukprot:CAMPEP_0181103378 /NCGR_PEP_ID=MMETSP1071-20121207/14832_1 /TAXON_ID=35127 /ORGANISM="Thalassiosira sp., Strain NH16" /LENGTH=312 /DNA_ID=CAMNT_0023186445 /DNA_START=40 /DNA_END=978 /DNA_ORIENTATION=-